MHRPSSQLDSTRKLCATGAEPVASDAFVSEVGSCLEDVCPLLEDAATVALGEVALRAAWRIVCEFIQAHPVTRICHEDPFTHRAYSKPRGYAGDAVSID
jgi:hypothetical protein